MLPSLFPSPDQAPAVRRPAFALRFGDATAEAWAGAVLSIDADLGLAPTVDELRTTLRGGAPRPGAGAPALLGAVGGAASAVAALAGKAADLPRPALADAGTVELGYDDSGLEVVFRGRLESLHRGLDGAMQAVAVNAAADLAALRLNRSFEDQRAGDVVQDLAAEAGVATGQIDDGVELPFIVVDDRRSAWSQIAELAARSGLAAWISAGGELTMAVPGGGEPVRTFTYGQDLLAIDAIEATSAAPLTWVGEGAAGSSGGDAWAWLVKDPAPLTAAAAGAARVMSDASLRSADAVRTAAAAHQGRQGAAGWRAVLRVPGAAAVFPAAAITVEGTPEAALDGSFTVRRVRHRYTKASGFTTLLTVERPAPPDSGGLLGLLGGLL